VILDVVKQINKVLSEKYFKLVKADFSKTCKL